MNMRDRVLNALVGTLLLLTGIGLSLICWLIWGNIT